MSSCSASKHISKKPTDPTWDWIAKHNSSNLNISFLFLFLYCYNIHNVMIAENWTIVKLNEIRKWKLGKLYGNIQSIQSFIWICSRLERELLVAPLLCSTPLRNIHIGRELLVSTPETTWFIFRATLLRQHSDKRELWKTPHVAKDCHGRNVYWSNGP